MTWQSVGTHTFVPTDKAVEVGSFDLAAGQDTIWVKITQLNNPGDWPWSYGILSWRNANGTPLGSVKAYSNRLGEVFRLGNGLAPLDGVGSIWFEPRGFNLGWIKAGFPWELQFEAQAGASDLTSGYWNRDPQSGVITPKTSGDNLDMTPGWIKAKNLLLTDGTPGDPGQSVPGYQQGTWSPVIDATTNLGGGFLSTNCSFSRVGNHVTLFMALAFNASGDTAIGDSAQLSNFPYPINGALCPNGMFFASQNVSILYSAQWYLLSRENSGSPILFLRPFNISGVVGRSAEIRGVVQYLTDDTTWSPS